MNKVELINVISEKTGLKKKQTEQFLKVFTETVTESLLADEKVSIAGFGTFETRERARKEAYNPVTKAKVTVEAKKVPAFKPSKAFKDTISKA
ncbi:MAG: HU family DNA-binding protein [Oscillospiraceae bacterium]|nr:HU family DNA-binding protein [Oscillospiraceae bacterium]